MATTTSNDIIDMIIDLIRQNIPKSRYKAIFYGDPLNVPQRLYPALTVMEVSNEAGLGATQKDVENHTIAIKQLIDKRMIVKDSRQEVFGLRLLRDWAFGKDENGKYKPESLYGLLRTKFHFPDSTGAPRILTQEPMNTEFQIDIDPAVTTYESTTTFVVQRRVNVDTRS